jgi:hypothetical protein
MKMALRPAVTLLVAALVPALGAQRAEAAIELGSPDPAAAPTSFACAACKAGAAVGFRQLALQGATAEAPEGGVLVSARAYAKRISGSEQPRIAVLRPADGIGATIADSAPLPVSSRDGALHETAGLHLAMEPGDSLGLVLRAGQVELGVRKRPNPDGAVVSFTLPCGPCGADGGTGSELLFGGTLEPDNDGDLLGDETQDPDGGGVLLDEFLGEPLDEDVLAADEPRPRRRLRLLRATAGRAGGATLVLAAPRAGSLAAAATARTRGRSRSRPAATRRRRIAQGRARSPGAGPVRLRLIAQGRARSPGAGRVRLRLRPSTAGRRLLARRGRLRTRLVIAFRPDRGRRQALTRTLTLRR